MLGGSEVKAEPDCSARSANGQQAKNGGNPTNELDSHRKLRHATLARDHRYSCHRGRNLADDQANSSVLAHRVIGRYHISVRVLPRAIIVRRVAAGLLCCFYSLWLVALVERCASRG